MKSTHRQRVLQNASICDYKHPISPTIRIVQGESTWDLAYTNWLAGKNPTDSLEWKKGVYLHFEQIDEKEELVSQSWLTMHKRTISIGLFLIALLALVIFYHYYG